MSCDEIYSHQQSSSAGLTAAINRKHTKFRFLRPALAPQRSQNAVLKNIVKKDLENVTIMLSFFLKI